MSAIGSVGTKIQRRRDPNDVFYTPLPVACRLIEMADIKPSDRVLDPSRGMGVFYDNLPPCVKDWCEITEGHDYFSYNQEVDVVIGNPPFSMWKRWIQHTVSLNPQKICFVMGCVNLTPLRFKMFEDAGYGLAQLHFVSIRQWFSNTFLVVFEKGKKSIMTYDIVRR